VPNLYPLLKPLLWRFPPETAHRVALASIRAAPSFLLSSTGKDTGLDITVFGRRFSNPVGLAAGFDKHAEAVSALFALGFGFIELGGVTRRPQDGNPKPRLFRLAEDEAIINRMGLNSVGVETFAAALEKQAGQTDRGPVAVNLGLNKDTEDPVDDYSALAACLAPLADILTINVSSPNTPGLRALQNPDKLVAILNGVREAAQAVPNSKNPAVLIKLAPDLEDRDITEICRMAERERVAGLVVSNTTVSRPDSLASPHKSEAGGLSGRPLFDLSTGVLRRIFSETRGAIPLIGVGGIGSGRDAYAKIRAGASLVQVYSMLVYEGPGLIGRMKNELRACLERDGFSVLSDAVGADHREKAQK
jgi:dihydroorotate dehydrogenase